MLKNKKKNMTPYDMSRKPAKQYPFLLPIIWGGSWLMTRQFKLKIDKSEIKGLKPPFLVIATHQGFSDYYIGPLSMFPHRAMYVSDMEGYAGFGNWLYRGLGCIPKRRYVADVSVIQNIKYGLSKGQSVFLYPESRHSNVGTTAYIPKNIGKLAKFLKVPVVTLSVNGSYLANPFWDEEHTRKVPMRAKLSYICSKEELKNISDEELQHRIEKKMEYNEYSYQYKNKILIKDKNRAQGLHKALYICRNCKTKFNMTSENSFIKCEKCGAIWELSEDGYMIGMDSKLTIPEWYEWERALEDAEISSSFEESYQVRVEALPNEYGFVEMGEGELVLNSEEFVLKIAGEVLHFKHRHRESVQTEYNYRGRGMCIVLSTKDCCYYLYGKDKGFQPTRFQFIGEYLFQNS